MNSHTNLAQRLFQAAQAVSALPALAPDELDVASGYALQRQGLQVRQQPLSGWKVAFTGAAAQNRFGLVEPVYGGLTLAMHLTPGSRVALQTLIQPKLEVELALILGRDLPAGDYSDEQILASLAEVAPAFEIVDCRWQGWQFGAGAFLADNAAAALYCLGAGQRFEAARYEQIDFRLEHDGHLIGRGVTGTGAESPLPILCWLVRRLLADGQTLRAGQVILSGALLAPIDIKPGHYGLTMFGTELALQFSSGQQAG